MRVVAMKDLCHNYAVWPKPNQNDKFEKVARHCETCQLKHRIPNKSVHNSCNAAESHWERILSSFTVRLHDWIWLLLIDVKKSWDIGSRTSTDVKGIWNLVSCCKVGAINYLLTRGYHPASSKFIESLHSGDLWVFSELLWQRWERSMLKLQW
jgi:hypothetical protein